MRIPHYGYYRKSHGRYDRLSGDYLIYKGADYQAFMQNYLGATLNFLDPDTVGEIYMTQEYH